jgi:hypothetical protein
VKCDERIMKFEMTFGAIEEECFKSASASDAGGDV